MLGNSIKNLHFLEVSRSICSDVAVVPKAVSTGNGFEGWYFTSDWKRCFLHGLNSAQTLLPLLADESTVSSLHVKSWLSHCNSQYFTFFTLYSSKDTCECINTWGRVAHLLREAGSGDDIIASITASSPLRLQVQGLGVDVQNGKDPHCSNVLLWAVSPIPVRLGAAVGIAASPLVVPAHTPSAQVAEQFWHIQARFPLEEALDEATASLQQGHSCHCSSRSRRVWGNLQPGSASVTPCSRTPCCDRLLAAMAFPPGDFALCTRPGSPLSWQELGN